MALPTGINLVVDQDTITAVAQRLVDWSNHDKRISFQVDTTLGQFFHVPEALAEEEYGPLLLKPGGTPVAFTPGQSVWLQPTVDDVAGIDPNSNVDDVIPPTGLAGAALIPSGARLTWTWTGPNHYEGFIVRYRKVAAEGEVPAMWTVVKLRGYARRLDLHGLEPGGAYEATVQSLESSRYYPVVSATTAVAAFTAGAAEEPPPVEPPAVA